MPRFLALLLLLILVPLRSQATERQFYSGYAGSLPSDAKDLARTYFDEPHVRDLISRLENGPLPRASVEQALAGSGFTAADLVRVRILRDQQGQFRIDFNYFNAADVRAIDAAAERYVPSLVRGYLQHREEFERIFRSYPIRTVSREKLAFVLIAGISLNWDGLRVSQALGYRKPALVQGAGWRYSFWASEDVPGRSKREFYWGSSTFPSAKVNLDPPVDFAFSSFGDPFSDPRMNFPDLLLIPASAMPPAVREAAGRIGLVHETALGMDVRNVLGLSRARDLAAILFALRAGAPAFPKAANASACLALLERTRYIARGEDRRFHLLVPVLDVGDRKLVDAALGLSRKVLSEWMKENYGKMREDLGSLTALRQGVPFESLFTQIWHEMFGLATMRLVHAGFIFDPQDEYQGSFPTLWRLALYDFDPQ